MDSLLNLLLIQGPQIHVEGLVLSISNALLNLGDHHSFQDGLKLQRTTNTVEDLGKIGFCTIGYYFAFQIIQGYATWVHVLNGYVQNHVDTSTQYNSTQYELFKETRHKSTTRGKASFSYSKWAMLIPILIMVLLPGSQQLQSSDVQTLLRIQKLLEYPSALKGQKNNTNFCNLTTSSSLTIICYKGTITQLKIVGEKGSPQNGNNTFSVSSQTLSSSFSTDSFLTTLYKVSSFKVLSLVSIGIWGPLPANIGR